MLCWGDLRCFFPQNKGRGSCVFDAETLAWLRAEGASVLAAERALREGVWGGGTNRSKRLAHHNNTTAITDEEVGLAPYSVVAVLSL